MKRYIFLFLCMLLPVTLSAANDAGSRASFSRTGWVGTRYIAMGKAAEVVVDDVFAIYWNPAGLLGIKGVPPLTPQEIEQKAKEGKIDSISEKDLLTFSQDVSSLNILQIGVSGGSIDISRYAGFGGIAYKIGEHALGCGVYSVRSPDIETYDVKGVKTGETTYMASIGFLSYATYIGDAAIGVSIKGLYEKVADITYAGGGADVGTIIEIIPFLKIGFVIQDIGTGLYPTDSHMNIKYKYDFGQPSLKLSASITNRASNFTISFTGIKKIEQKSYEANVGFELMLHRNLTIYLGLNNSLFTTGCEISIGLIDIGYAFSFDSVNSGYNNFISMKLAI